MSHKQRRVFWPVLIVVVITLGAGGLIAGRLRPAGKRREEKTPTAPLLWQTKPQPEAAKNKSVSPRNLSMQPEAFNMGRRLGERFAAGHRERSVMQGVLRVGNEQQNVLLERRQSDDGEEIELTLGKNRLSWKATDGALSAGARARGPERELIERLVLDSPDQFVLAQLRGASYSTVARNVRPADAGENYSGPLWNIVRVDDPQRDEEKKPQSAWRLYYVNTRTGLIDRIVSQLQGETIEAEISGWSNQNGENVPGRITWTSNGQTIMQYRLTNFSHAQQ